MTARANDDDSDSDSDSYSERSHGAANKRILQPLRLSGGHCQSQAAAPSSTMTHTKHSTNTNTPTHTHECATLERYCVNAYTHTLTPHFSPHEPAYAYRLCICSVYGSRLVY